MATGGAQVCHRTGKKIYPADKKFEVKNLRETWFFSPAGFTCKSTGARLTMKSCVVFERQARRRRAAHSSAACSAPRSGGADARGDSGGCVKLDCTPMSSAPDPVIDSPPRTPGPRLDAAYDTSPPTGHGAAPSLPLFLPSFSPLRGFTPTYPVTGVAPGRVASAMREGLPLPCSLGALLRSTPMASLPPLPAR